MVYRNDTRKGKTRRRYKGQSSPGYNHTGNPTSHMNVGGNITPEQQAALVAAMGGGNSNSGDTGGYTSNFGGFLNDTVNNVAGMIKGGPMRAEPQTLMRAKPKTPEQSSMDILDQLVQGMIMDSGSQSYDYESAMAEAAQGIRQAYGAEIAAIRGNNRAARKNTKKARREIEAMYAGLAKSYGKSAKEATVQGEKEAKNQMNIGKQGNAILANENTKINQQESDMLKGLGLTDIGAEILGDNNKQFSGAIAQNTRTANRNAQAERSHAQSNSRYYDRYAAGASFEGATRSSDLLSQLQDYIRGNRDQIAGLKGDRAKEIGASNAAIQGQAAQMQAQQDSETWDRLMQYMNFKADLENTNFDNNLAAQKFKYDQLQNGGKSGSNYMPDNLNNAMQLIAGNLGPQKAQRVSSILQGLFSSPEFRYNSATGPNGQEYKLTPFQAAEMAAQAGQQAGLSPQEIQILRLAAMSSVG